MAQRRHSEGPRTREGPWGPTGPEGWVLGAVPAAEHLYPGDALPASDPPSPWEGPLPAVAGRREGSHGGWVVPRYSPPYYHPVYPPWYHTPPGDLSQRMHHSTVAGTTGACTYDRFGDTVGEPRGIRTHCIWHCLALFGTVWPLLALFGTVLTLFWHCFTEFSTCSTEFRLELT